MKRMSSLTRLAALTLTALLLLLALASCVDMFHGNMEDGQKGEQFIDLLLADNAAEAYKLFDPTTVPLKDFNAWWAELRAVAAGATTAEITGRGWNANTKNGVTTNEYTYQIEFDNGSTMMLYLLNQKAGERFVGGTYRDATDFISKTGKAVPVVSVVLTVYSILTLAFTVWMIVDCARRRIKYKALWIIINIAALSLTLTIGEQATISFLVGLFLQFSSISESLAALSVTVKLIIPVGSIVYFCLRKRLTKPQDAPVSDAPATDAPASDAYDLAATEQAPADFTEATAPAEPTAPADPADSTTPAE